MTNKRMFGSKTQAQLIDELISNETLRSDRVKQVMLQVDRADFTSRFPYLDVADRIGCGATISAPHMHACALEHLESVIKEGSHVLDVGSGSGYLTTCFALMVGRTGKVVGDDHIPELVANSIVNVRKHHAALIDEGRMIFTTGDGRNGFVQEAPYDAIHVGAAAEEVPQSLIDQLAVGGRMILPLTVDRFGNQELVQIDKRSSTETVRTNIIPVIYVPLTTREEQLRRYT